MRIFGPLFAATLLAGNLWAAPKEVASNLDLARQLNQAFVEVAEKVTPSVVVINVVEKPSVTSTNEESDLENLPPWLRRYHRELEQLPTHGQGSGVIIRKDGFILTNRHVVEDAQSIDVRLNDGRTFKATVRGVDPQSDVAVVKIDAKDLPVATLADSSKTRVGEFAIAIGAPYSLDYSVTYGHVSAKGRSNVIPNYAGGAAMDQDFIQTDANINPGNSGGPLLNIEGEVIGINTLIHGLRTGIGFAIPSNLAKEVAEKLIADGKFTRAWLGISIRALRDDPDLRTSLKGPEDGVLVAAILPNGPAAKSDLHPSDVITAVDGAAVATPQQLRSAIRTKPIGEPVTLEVFRKSKKVKVKVSPGEWVEPVEEVAVKSSDPPAGNGIDPDRLGLTVHTMNRALIDEYGLEASTGVVVTSVETSALGARKGIKVGDVITSINDQPVTTPSEFSRALRTADLVKGIDLVVMSGAKHRTETLQENRD